MSVPDCPTLHFPTECPECKHVSGMPYMATATAGNRVIVSLRCLGCGHRWDCTLTTAASLIPPRKADRDQP